LEDPERAGNFREVEKDLYRFLETPPRMPQAKQWIDTQTKDRAK